MRLLLLAVLLLWPTRAPALEISAIYPQTASSGTPVTLIGGPFDADVLVNLAGQDIRPRSLGSRQLIFIVPSLPAGEYALYLHSGGESSPQTYSLRIELPAPEILSLEPAIIDQCSAREQRQVRLQGRHIQPGAQLQLDGRGIPFELQDDGFLAFLIPELRAGSYGLQLLNPDGKLSLPQTLWINNVPEIESVSQGEDFVNYYQVEIRGKNFLHNSTLIVDEYPGGFADLPPRQRLLPVQGRGDFSSENPRAGQVESLSYRDCNSLIYNRYPPTGQSMRLILRVGNPDGKQTDPFEVFLP